MPKYKNKLLLLSPLPRPSPLLRPFPPPPPTQNVATAAIFLAAKVEEQPRKLEYVAKVSHSCQNRDAPMLDTQSEVGGARDQNTLVLMFVYTLSP